MVYWKAQNLLKGNDGYATGAVVRAGEEGKRSLLLHRRVQRLYPLEVQDTKTEIEMLSQKGRQMSKLNRKTASHQSEELLG